MNGVERFIRFLVIQIRRNYFFGLIESDVASNVSLVGAVSERLMKLKQFYCNLEISYGNCDFHFRFSFVNWKFAYIYVRDDFSSERVIDSSSA